MTTQERVQLAIQTLWTPVLDHSPTHANVERMQIIERTVAILLLLLQELKTGRQSILKGD